jgi:signal transduction histidine kinase
MATPPTRRRPSVRLRTAVAACLALAPAVTLFSVAGVLVQRHQLTDGVALVAEEQAEGVATSLSRAGAAGGPALSRSTGNEANLIQVIGANGQVVAATPALQGRSALLTTGDLSSGTRRTMTGLVPGESDEYIVVSAAAGHGRHVVAAQSLESVDRATSSTLGLLAVGAPMLVLLVGGLSYLLVGRALRPVERLRSDAAEITAADSTARLPPVETGDEIERLAVTLNEMLARLQTAANAQRQFVADASHELRSPIATIRTLHEVALATGPEANGATTSQEVLVEVSRLERLVADLLLLARPSAPPNAPFEPLDLSAVVREEAARARGVPVFAEIQPGVLVRGHPDSLAMSVRNVLDNAERHTASRIDLRLDAEDGRAVLTVGDDGAGIPAADRERIFDRFVRLDDARARDDGGAGLGLAICRHVLNQHDGTIRADGPPVGEPGSVFVVEIPLAAAPSAARTPGGEDVR